MVGWYSSGPKLKLNDIQINEVFMKYMPEPVLVVVDVEMIVILHNNIIESSWFTYRSLFASR
jgi:hypothetical protein